MAAGLFASLFAGSSSNTCTESRSSAPKVPQDHAPSDEADSQSAATSDHEQDVVMSEVAQSATSAESIPNESSKMKEAQEVADVDMELSSPPSSPPPSAPLTPTEPSASLSRPLSAKMEPSSSDSSKPVSSSSASASGMERSLSADRAASNSTPAIQRTSRRRMMPARLSQVSSLLAGSSLEEELLLIDPASSPSGSSFPRSASATTGKVLGTGDTLPAATSSSLTKASGAFTSSSIVVLTSDAQVLARAVFPYAPNTSPFPNMNIKAERDETGSLSSKGNKTLAAASKSLVSTLGIKRQQLIETPDFKPRDDTLYMPKTRGLRSEAAEDTSDAAYERRHRKPETAEKRQRKAEVDRLSRDRQKLLSRIDQLKTVEARTLQPIVVARDQVRAEAASASTDDHQPPHQAESKPLHERIEDIRQELLADAYETLKRYDLLLSISSDAKTGSPGPSALPNKIDVATNRSIAASAEDVSTRSESPRLKIRIKGGRATWDTTDSPSPASKQSCPSPDKSGLPRRVSSRQPKQRVDSLPTPLTAAAVEADEDGRRKRRRLSGARAQDHSPSQRNDTAAHEHDSPTKIRSEALSPERRTRRRGSPELGGTYKGKSREIAAASPVSGNRRPQRAAAAAAAVASARQRKFAERSFSDFDYEDENDDEEVESALDDVGSSPHQADRRLNRRASHTLRQSPLKTRDQRSPSAASTVSSLSSMASSLGYMYPTINDTGSFKVSQSLVEIQSSDPEATAAALVDTSSKANLAALADNGEGARKRIKRDLSHSLSTSESTIDEVEARKGRAAGMLDSETEHDEPKLERARGFGAALTEKEAESILAAFLGTTPIGKSAKSSSSGAANTKSTENGANKMPAESKTPPASASATARAPVPAEASPHQSIAPSKRRSSRRDTTQSFGEKLPDLISKTAPFDYSVMGYFRSIDRPSGLPLEVEQDAEEK